MFDLFLTPEELLFIERAVFDAKTNAIEQMVYQLRRRHASWIGQNSSPRGPRRHIASARARIAAGSPGVAIVGRRALLSAEALAEELEALSSRVRAPRKIPVNEGRSDLNPAEAHEREMDRLYDELGLQRVTNAERTAKGMPPYDRDREYAEFLEQRRLTKEREAQKERDDNDPNIAAERAAATRALDATGATKRYKIPRVPCPRCKRPIRMLKNGEPIGHQCPHAHGYGCHAAKDDPSALNSSRPWYAKEWTEPMQMATL